MENTPLASPVLGRDPSYSSAVVDHNSISESL